MVSLDFRNQVRMKLRTYEYESILLPTVYRSSSVGGGGRRYYEFLIRGLIEANG